MRNVSRCWAYETGLAAGVELGKGTNQLRVITNTPIFFSSEIPMNEYYEYFGPDYELDVKASNMDDMNSPEYLDRVKSIVLDHLRQVGGPPSVQMTGILFEIRVAAVFADDEADIPRMPVDDIVEDDPDEDMADPNDRRPMRLLDSRRQAEGELSDSDDEGEGGRRDHASHKDRDSVATGRRFGAAVGIMSTGTTHGVGPSVAPPVASGSGGGQAISAEQSDMEVDDGVPLAQIAKAKAGKANGSGEAA